MKVDSLFARLVEENKEIELMLDNPITLNNCIKTFWIIHNFRLMRVVVNLYTMDIINSKSIKLDLKRKLFILIEDNEPIRNSKRVERRAFCDFLKLKYRQEYRKVRFLDRESPDYLIFRNEKEYAYEVVEATNVREAQFKTMMRLNSGRGKTKKEYTSYALKKHKTHGDKFSIDEFEGTVIASPYEGLVDTCMTREQIVETAIKKVNKYKDYIIDSDEKNIIIFYSSLGYDNEWDYKSVGEMMAKRHEIRESNINRIFVVSGQYETLVEYDKDGSIVGMAVDNSV